MLTRLSDLDILELRPLVYSETGVYRDIHYFSYFYLNERLWVLVRTASIFVMSKNEKNSTFFHLKIVILTVVKI